MAQAFERSNQTCKYNGALNIRYGLETRKQPKNNVLIDPETARTV
jgi:hypothetical protein